MSLMLQPKPSAAAVPAPGPAPPITSAALTFDQMWELSGYVAKSGLFGVKTPEQAMTLMALCQSEGLHPMQALRRYHILNGRTAMRADAMQAEFQARGGVIKIVDRTPKVARAIFSHPVHQPEPFEFSFTMEDAQRAELTGPTGMYKKYPTQMLWARLISDTVRAIYPGIVAGIYSEYEVADMPPVEAHYEPPREAQPPAARPAKKDNRRLDEVIVDLLSRAEGKLAGEFPKTRTKITNGHAVERHLLKFAAALDGEEVEAGLPQREVGKRLAEMYAGKRRGAIRKELGDYLALKLGEAMERAAAEAGSETPEGDEATDVTEDAVLDAFVRGDAYEGPDASEGEGV